MLALLFAMVSTPGASPTDWDRVVAEVIAAADRGESIAAALEARVPDLSSQLRRDAKSPRLLDLWGLARIATRTPARSSWTRAFRLTDADAFQLGPIRREEPGRRSGGAIAVRSQFRSYPTRRKRSDRRQRRHSLSIVGAVRTPFDRFAKEAWSAILERAAKVETEAEVAADVQFVDLTFEPDPTKLDALDPFGLVARMVREGPGLLEFFHSAPTIDDVLFCIQKQIERRRKRKKAADPAPRLWILTAGRPAKALDELGFAHDATWPWGIYRCAPGFLVKVIVVSDLPATRDTLLLRMLGAGPVLRAAADELTALPEDAPECSVVLPIVLRLWGERGSAAQSAEDEDFYMSTQDIVQQWERELLEKGAAKKARDMVTRLLCARFGALDAAAESRISKASVEELDRWIERVIVAERIEDVFGE